MATLVSDAPIQQSKPEIIFVADQSGSMQGARTDSVAGSQKALRVFALDIGNSVSRYGIPAALSLNSILVLYLVPTSMS